MPPADAPWEKAQNVGSRPKRPKGERMAAAQRNKIVLIVVAVVGTTLFFAGLNYAMSDPEEETFKPLTSEQEAAIQNERQAAELQIQAVIAQLRADWSTGIGPDAAISRIQKQFEEGKYQTPHYQVTQATLTRRVGPNAMDVVIVCYPKETATNTRGSCYAEFRWDNESFVKLEWR